MDKWIVQTLRSLVWNSEYYNVSNSYGKHLLSVMESFIYY